MATHLFAALLTLLNLTSTTASKPIAEPRIVGGLPVSADDYPWMVSLKALLFYEGFQYTIGPFCGASLIALSPPTILTAAHCVDGDSFVTDDDGVSSMFFRSLGGYLPVTLQADINRTDPDEFVGSFETLNWTAAQMTIHPEWNGSDIATGFDIALIAVDDGQSIASLSDDDLPRIPSATLAGNEACCEVDDHLDAIGYGLNHSNGTGTDTLEHTTVHFVDVEECMDTILASMNVSTTFEIDNRVVCA